MFLLAYV